LRLILIPDLGGTEKPLMALTYFRSKQEMPIIGESVSDALDFDDARLGAAVIYSDHRPTPRDSELQQTLAN